MEKETYNTIFAKQEEKDRSDIIVFMRIQYVQGQSFVTEIVTLTSLKQEKLSWFTKMATGKCSVDCCFLPTPLAPHAWSPASLALSSQMLSPFPLHPLVALPPRLLLSLMFPCIVVQGPTSSWTRLQSPHITLKTQSYLTGRKPDLESWIHCSVVLRGQIWTQWHASASPSGMAPASPASHLCHIQVWCIHILNREGKSLLLHLHAFHFSLSLLFLLAHLLLWKLFFTITHSVMLLTTSTDLCGLH